MFRHSRVSMKPPALWNVLVWFITSFKSLSRRKSRKSKNTLWYNLVYFKFLTLNALSLVFILKYCLSITLLPNFLVRELEDTKKFGSKVINRHFFHRKTVFHMKILSIIEYTTKVPRIKNYFLNAPL